jgi:hypothetical protein
VVDYLIDKVNTDAAKPSPERRAIRKVNSVFDCQGSDSTMNVALKPDSSTN